MDLSFILKFLNEQFVIGGIQLFVGKYLKDNPKVSNKVIPVITYIVALLGFQLAPATAHAAGEVLAATGGAINVFTAALFQNVLVTGVHSSFKNTIVPALKAVVGFIGNLLTGLSKQE